MHSPELNICAPKPHQRCGPRLYPVPVGFNAFLVLEGGVIHATAREMSHVFAAGVNNLAERVYKFLDMC